MISYIEKNIYPLLRLAIPLSLTGLINSAISFFLIMFIVQLGPDILAVGALVGGLTQTFVAVIMGIFNSVNIQVARQHGAQNKEAVLLIARDGIYLALLLAVPTMFVFWNIAPVFFLFGQSPATVAHAESFLHAWCWGVFPQFTLIAVLQVLVGLGEVSVILMSNIVKVLVSVLFSFIFIFGTFNLPPLGLSGAGYGLSLGNWLCMIGLLIFITLSPQYQIRSTSNNLVSRTNPAQLMVLLKIGLPIGLMYCMEVGLFFALTLLMSHFGSVVLAANQIVIQYYGVLIPIMFAIAQALTVRMGHLLGAGDSVAAKNTGYAGLYLAGVVIAFIALLCWFFPITLISLDIDVNQRSNNELTHYSIQFFSICALYQIFEVLRISLFGALRALKDTYFPMMVSIVSIWGIALPIGYYTAIHLKIGAVGLWWGMVLGAAFGMLMLGKRFINHFKIDPTISQF